MSKVKNFGVTILVLLAMSSCAAGPNTAQDTVAGNGDIAGFWYGIWHGIISPVTFIVSLFDHTVNFYEVHNTGATYNLGFVIAAGILLGGAWAAD